jgi:hypothetical protein
MDVVDLQNKKFGKLLVKEYIGKTGVTPTHDGYHSWRCECECGKELEVRSVKLRSGYTKSCGCLRKYNKPIWTLPEGEAAKNLVYGFYKKSAQKRNLDFSLTKESFISIVSRNCHYCNSEPSKSAAMRHKGVSKSRSLNGDFLYTGIDRADNSIGYVDGNCVPCCWKCNQWKKADNEDDFINHAKKIAKWRNDK